MVGLQKRLGCRKRRLLFPSLIVLGKTHVVWFLKDTLASPCECGLGDVRFLHEWCTGKDRPLAGHFNDEVAAGLRFDFLQPECQEFLFGEERARAGYAPLGVGMKGLDRLRHAFSFFFGDARGHTFRYCFAFGFPDALRQPLAHFLACAFGVAGGFCLGLCVLFAT